jgi:hypothetical protein
MAVARFQSRPKGARIGIFLDATQNLERLHHGVTVQGLGFQVDEDFEVKIRTTHSEHLSLECGASFAK